MAGPECPALARPPATGWPSEAQRPVVKNDVHGVDGASEVHMASSFVQGSLATFVSSSLVAVFLALQSPSIPAWDLVVSSLYVGKTTAPQASMLRANIGL